MNRVEHFLNVLMKNPGKWVRITKLKHQRPSKENTAERVQVMKQITAALDLMGINHLTKGNTQFTIKVLPDPKAAGVQMHVDLAKKIDANTTVMYGYRMSGKTPMLAIIDEVHGDIP